MAPAPKTIWVENFLTWELKDFDWDEFKNAAVSSNPTIGYFDGHVVRNTDRYTNIEREGKFKLEFYPEIDDAVLTVDIVPPVLEQNYSCIVDNGKNEYVHINPSIKGKYSKVTFCVHIKVLLPDLKITKTLGDKMRKILAEDPTNKFIIKCQDVTFETLKLVLAASSPVFKAMFDSGMKESKESSMEVIDFKPKVIQKMIEFCETDKIVNFEDLEEEVFKIAHKYQIEELMDCVLSKMIETTTDQNRLKRQYMFSQLSSNFEDFKKWCSYF